MATLRRVALQQLLWLAASHFAVVLTGNGQFCRVTKHVEVALTLWWQQTKAAKCCCAFWLASTASTTAQVHRAVQHVHIYRASNSCDIEAGPSTSFWGSQEHVHPLCACLSPLQPVFRALVTCLTALAAENFRQDPDRIFAKVVHTSGIAATTTATAPLTIQQVRISHDLPVHEYHRAERDSGPVSRAAAESPWHRMWRAPSRCGVRAAARGNALHSSSESWVVVMSEPSMPPA